MENCLLCKEKAADKKGSHIVPHFLIQSMYNSDGVKGRDKEISMEIGQFSLGHYFGRAVSVEKISEILGRGLKDEEISSQSNPFVLDYIFCTRCENRLGKIESYYARESSKIKHQAGNLYCNNSLSIIATIFWASVFWRISATKIAAIKETPEDFEYLRSLLNDSLPDEEAELEQAILKHKERLVKISYFLIRPEEIKKETKSVFLISPENSCPYTVIINDYVLFFSVSDIKDKCVFFDFETYIDDKASNFQSCKNEIIIKVSNEQFQNSLKKISQFKANLYKTELESHLDGVHKKMFNFPIPAVLLGYTMNKIIHEDKGNLTPAQRYDLKRINAVFANEISKWYPPETLLADA